MDPASMDILQSLVGWFGVALLAYGLHRYGARRRRMREQARGPDHSVPPQTNH